MITITDSKGLLCPENDPQPKLQSALPDYKVLAGGYVEFYNLSYIKDKTEHHLNYIFRTPLEAQECASYLQFIYCLNYQVTKDLLCLAPEAIAEFKQQASYSIKLLDKYRTKTELLNNLINGDNND